MRKQGKPLVLIDRTSNAIEATKIVIDNERSSYDAVNIYWNRGAGMLVGFQVPRNCRWEDSDKEAMKKNEPFDPLINPSLSSMYQPANLMGQEAARLILEHLKETTFVPRHRIFDTELIVRESSCLKSGSDHDTAGHPIELGKVHLHP